MNGTLLITSELTNQRPESTIHLCGVNTNIQYSLFRSAVGYSGRKACCGARVAAFSYQVDSVLCGLMLELAIDSQTQGRDFCHFNETTVIKHKHTHIKKKKILEKQTHE